MRTLTIILIFVQMGFCKSLFAQGQNLISDPSFESYDSCEDILCGFTSDWCRLIGTVDIYSPCDTEKFVYNGYLFTGYHSNVPNNWVGGEEPLSGSHYAGFSPFLFGFSTDNNASEIPMIKLTNPLEANHKYDFQFYVSLADSFWYATKSIDVFFGKSIEIGKINQCFLGSGELNLPIFRSIFIPQWHFNGNFITNKMGWTKLSGSYIAEGTEEYMAIGNFCGDDCNMDTLLVPPLSYVKNQFYDAYVYKGSYYYLDNVSLWEDTTYIGIEQPDFEQSKVFISENGVNIFLSNYASPLSIEIYDATGRQAFTTLITQRESHFPMPQLSQGVYSYSLVYKDRIVKRGKVVF